MKLYYAPGACSLAPHIVSLEAGTPLELVKVDLKTKRTADGADFAKINPRGYVPALDMGGGDLLTEANVIVQYLADKKSAAGLLAAPGTRERLKTQQWLAFIATELHKGIAAFFNPKLQGDYREASLAKVNSRLADLEATLAKTPYLTGETFTVADAYAFNVLTWTKPVGIDIKPYPHVLAFMKRVGSRPHVQAAMKAEGLI
ncbi:MAG: glutathione transferase GstA [Pseudomonadota bacterium]